MPTLGLNQAVSKDRGLTLLSLIVSGLNLLVSVLQYLAASQPAMGFLIYVPIVAALTPTLIDIQTSAARRDLPDPPSRPDFAMTQVALTSAENPLLVWVATIEAGSIERFWAVRSSTPPPAEAENEDTTPPLTEPAELEQLRRERDQAVARSNDLSAKLDSANASAVRTAAELEALQQTGLSQQETLQDLGMRVDERDEQIRGLRREIEVQRNTVTRDHLVFDGRLHALRQTPGLPEVGQEVHLFFEPPAPSGEHLQWRVLNNCRHERLPPETGPELRFRPFATGTCRLDLRIKQRLQLDDVLIRTRVRVLLPPAN